MRFKLTKVKITYTDKKTNKEKFFYKIYLVEEYTGLAVLVKGNDKKGSYDNQRLLEKLASFDINE